MQKSLTKAFDEFIQSEEYMKAKEGVENTLGPSPEYSSIIKLAQEDDINAKIVLYAESTKMVAHVFWKNFMGPNKKIWKSRLDKGDDMYFAGEAFEVLDKALNSFNINKYSNTDILRNFQFWYGRYLRMRAVKLNKEEAKHGATGKGTLKQPVASLDTGIGKGEKSLSHPDHASATNLEDALNSYIDKLKNADDSTSAKLLQALEGRLQGQSAEDIAADLGMSDWNFRKLMRTLKDDMTQYGLFESNRKLFRKLFTLREDKSTEPKIPDWAPLGESNFKKALTFKKIAIDDKVTHHVSPCFIVIERQQRYGAGKKVNYAIYFRKTSPKGVGNYAQNSVLIDATYNNTSLRTIEDCKDIIKSFAFNAYGIDT